MNKINKICIISIICMISMIFMIFMISVLFAYSTYGAPSEFGNETMTTCWVGGDDGVVNCTGYGYFGGNFEVDGNTTFNGPLYTGCLHCEDNDTYFHGNVFSVGNITAPNIEIMESLIVHGSSNCTGTAVPCSTFDYNFFMCGIGFFMGQSGCYLDWDTGECLGEATTCEDMSLSMCDFQSGCQGGYSMGFWYDEFGFGGDLDFEDLTTFNDGIDVYGHSDFDDATFYDNVSILADLYVENNIEVDGNITADNFFGTLNWSDLSGYPIACPAGSALTQLGDSVICTSFVPYTGATSNLDLESYNLTASNFFGNFEGNSSIWSRAGTNTFLTNVGDMVGIGRTPISTIPFLKMQLYGTNVRGTFFNVENDGATGYVAGGYQITSNSASRGGVYLNYNSATKDTWGFGVPYGVPNDYQIGFVPDGSLSPFYQSQTLVQKNAILTFKGDTKRVGVLTSSPLYNFVVNGTFSINNATGVQGLFQLANANVGIGTTTPQNTLNVIGDGNFTGNLYGSLIYGEAWYHNHTATEIDFAVDGLYYNLTFDNSLVNGMTFNDAGDYLEVDLSGVYKISYTASGDGQNNHIYYTDVTINGVVQDKCESHKKMTAGGDVVTMTGSCLLSLKIDDQVKLATADIGDTGTGNYYSSNLNLVRIGN